MKNVGYEIHRIIEEKKLIKRRVAADAGIDPTYLAQLRSRESIDAALLERLCKAIGISPGYFFDDWPCDQYSTGDINNMSNTGNATVNVGHSIADKSNSDEVIATLKQLVDEKERLIKVLLNQLGM